MPSIDFADVPSIEPVPDGWYKCEVVEAKDGVSGSGEEKIDVQWKVLDGEFKNRRIWDTLSFHPNALGFTKGKLRSMDPEKFGKNFSGEVYGEDLVGIVCNLSVYTKYDENNINPQTGEPYDPQNKVKKIKTLAQSVEDLL